MSSDFKGMWTSCEWVRKWQTEYNVGTCEVTHFGKHSKYFTFLVCSDDVQINLGLLVPVNVILCSPCLCDVCRGTVSIAAGMPNEERLSRWGLIAHISN